MCQNETDAKDGLLKRILTSVFVVTFLALITYTYELLPTWSSPDFTSINNNIMSSNTADEPSSPTILLGIFSTDSDKEDKRRRLIRSTYLQNDIDKGNRICSLDEVMTNVRQTWSKENRCWIVYTFVIGAGDETRPTDHNDDEPLLVDPFYIENSEEDVIYLNIQENMEDGKSPTYFKFGASIAKEFGIDYIAKIDSDSLMSTDLFLDFIDDNLPPSPYNKRMYGGVLWGNPEHKLVYGAGQFYFMSVDLADYVGNTLTADDRKKLMSKRRPTEDMDMGAFVFSHPKTVKFMNLSYYIFWSHPLKETKKWMKEANNGYKKNPGRAHYVPFFALCPPAGYTKETP